MLKIMQTSIFRPSTIVPCSFSRASSASTLFANVTKPNPYFSKIINRYRKEKQSNNIRNHKIKLIFSVLLVHVFFWFYNQVCINTLSLSLIQIHIYRHKFKKKTTDRVMCEKYVWVIICIHSKNLWFKRYLVKFKHLANSGSGVV